MGHASISARKSRVTKGNAEPGTVGDITTIVFRNCREAILIADPDGAILQVNPAFTQITGYSPREAVGQSLHITCAHHPDAFFYDNLWEELRESGHWQGETWNRRSNGEPFPEWLSISEARDDAGRISHYVAVFSDISAIQQSQAELEHLAHHDALTNLPNRLLFSARLEHALAKARRRQTQCAVMFMDLDRFKHINDSLGHAVGDKVLTAIAERLHQQLRGEDTLARMGGDEFTVLLEDTNPRFAASVATKLLAVLDRPVVADEHELYLSGSIGIALYPSDGEEAEILIRNADAAMYKAKNQGRNNLQFYTHELTSDAFERVFLESHLRRAQRKGEFCIYYQPQVDLITGQFIGLEALLRWQHPELGLVSPDRFVPLLEDSGLILPIGEEVLQVACERVRPWFEEGLLDGRISVNVAGLQITRGDLPSLVDRVLTSSRLPARHLELEVTETFIMSKPESTICDLQKVRDMGVKVAIDDFGTGYSSLAYLKRLPIDRLKIDQSFVRDLPGDREDEAITHAIVALGKSLNMEVIAEGIEDSATAQFLRAAGCRQGQGFLYGRPIPAEQTERLLASAQPAR